MGDNLKEERKDAFAFYQKQEAEIAAERAEFNEITIVSEPLHERSFHIGYMACFWIGQCRGKISQSAKVDIKELTFTVGTVEPKRLPFEFGDKSDFDSQFKNEVSRSTFKVLLHLLSGDATTAKALREDRAKMLQWIDEHYCCGCGGLKWEESPKDERCGCTTR